MRERTADGFVLIVVLLAIMLLSALGSALVLTTSTESRIAANFGSSAEGLDAAEAIVELSLAEIVAVPDWNQLLSGAIRSSFVDGAPTGSRQLADGSVIDLSQVVNMANCEAPTACAAADMDLTTADRPWGPNNPRWTLFAHGRLPDVLPGRIESPYYVILLVADDPAENDNDPATDGSRGTNPGSGVIALRAEAFGAGGAHKGVELTVTRDGGIARVLTWHELR
ncbi:MAG TPA: pilus assembly PilX N-terminal domain-containing protein [Vicinamibacterales bacterium]